MVSSKRRLYDLFLNLAFANHTQNFLKTLYYWYFYQKSKVVEQFSRFDYNQSQNI